MSVLALILIVAGLLVAALAIGGRVPGRRGYVAEAAELHARAREADRQLAAAHADDKGWERSALEGAARSAYAERRGREPAELLLVQVVDRPGVAEDEA